MRKQSRPAKPEVLLQAGDFNKQWAELRTKNPSAQFTWTRKGQNIRALILPSLKLMNQSHCSFCDAFPLDDGDQEVEHFRPKTNPKFYSLAYSWKNLYFICRTCNGRKRADFDERILAPDEADYECSLYFYFDTTTGEIHPHPSSTTKNQERAEITIEAYSLNTTTRSSLRKQVARYWLQSQTHNEDSHIDEFGYRDFLESHATQPHNSKSFLKLMKEKNKK